MNWSCLDEELDRQRDNEIIFTIAAAVVTRTLFDAVDPRRRREAIEFIRHGTAFRCAWSVLTDGTNYTCDDIAKKVLAVRGSHKRKIWVHNIAVALGGVGNEGKPSPARVPFKKSNNLV